MEMNIACATDNRFAPYCGIMLTSLFENNKKNSFSVFILTKGLSKENVAKLNLLASHYHSTITMIELDSNNFAACPIEDDRMSIVTYYRLALPFVLPSDIHRVLYLDVDIIVNNQIDALYNIDINDVALSACVDLNIDEVTSSKVGVPKEQYFNAGVLLINVDFWRRNHIAEKCFEFIKDNPNLITYWDQDALNATLHNAIPFMDITYNFRSRYIYEYFFHSFSDDIKRRVSRCALNPVIVHFASMDKPWHKIYAGPYQSLFLYYKKRSLWADTPQQKNYQTLRQYLGWLRRLFEMEIGLRRPLYMTRKELLKLSNKEKAT